MKQRGRKTQAQSGKPLSSTKTFSLLLRSPSLQSPARGKGSLAMREAPSSIPRRSPDGGHGVGWGGVGAKAASSAWGTGRGPRLSVRPSTHPSLIGWMSLPVCLSIHRSVLLPAACLCQSVPHQSSPPALRLCLHLSVRRSAYPSVCPSLSLSLLVHQSACPTA